jgi:hypothetical protein
MLRGWLSAGVRAAAVVTGIALAAGCSTTPQTSSSAVTLPGGLQQFCRTNKFPSPARFARPATGAAAPAVPLLEESGGPGNANGTVTLCARYRYQDGVTTLAEVRGSFTAASGYLERPSLRFNVETLAVPDERSSVLVPWMAIPAQASAHASSADTGWFAAARLTGHSEGSLSWQQATYLSLELMAGGASGAIIAAGDAGTLVPAPVS